MSKVSRHKMIYNTKCIHKIILIYLKTLIIVKITLKNILKLCLA